jgi:hypothetical protein
MSLLDSFFAAPAHMAPKKTIPIVEAKKHARLGASGAARWTICHLSPRLEDGQPDSSGTAAEIGTICHDLGEQCLKLNDDSPLSMALGKKATVDDHGLVTYLPAHAPEGHVITEAMIEWVTTYIDFIRKMVMAGAKLRVEARLSIEHITGEPDAMGTSDSVLHWPEELCIADLKCGFKRVYAKRVLIGVELERAPEAMKTKALVTEVLKPNVQLVMYAEAALEDLRKTDPAAAAQIKRMRYIIVQPTLNHIDEYTVDLEEHAAWVQWIREQAAATRSPFAEAHPGPEQCMYCKAYPCPTAEQKALEVAFDGFAALDAERVRQPSVEELPRLKRLLPMLENYIKYINARVYNELSAGRPVPGYKLVPGDEGDRYFDDEDSVRTLLVKAGVSRDQIINEKLKSPAQIEKMTKGRNKVPEVVKVWDELQAHIKRDAASSNKVVEDVDARQAIKVNPVAGFDFEPDPSFTNNFFNV